MPRKWTPPYLKGLAENRSRIAGDVDRYRSGFAQLRRKLAESTRELEACDSLIRRIDARLDPTQIETNMGQSTHYPDGKRGILIEFLSQELAKAAPGSMTTDELVVELQLQIGLSFVSPEAQKKWTHNSLTRQLNMFVKQGLVERLHSGLFRSNSISRWRWKQSNVTTLADLKAQVEATGGTVIQGDDDEPS
ncbi:MAG TPA: hypothetical protein VGV09_15660 [Steroidobacteraceae bacterium]|nr:hypothetical protein [Steroidobacteraceae bacterium]